jgi:hypothetical protein
MSNYASSQTSGTAALGCFIAGGLVSQLFGGIQQGPQPRLKVVRPRAYVASGPVALSPNTPTTKLVDTGSIDYAANRVVFGSALARFAQKDAVRTTGTVRALAAQALANRARRKKMSSEEWAERLIQRTHDD